jgi:alkanesulfonate monooxygenase SsuD/methylene tetrahydromethanopterin reductase-like flavin-dependent oxidoreductase (luciferase family)
VDPSLRLAVELPPVPAGGSTGRVSLEPWWHMALASVRAGAGVVWFTGGAAASQPAGHGFAGLACDACTIAAAAVTLEATALLGVVSTVPVDRHPAVLARDVTTLDVVSGGRAALLLRWAGAGVREEAPSGASGEPPAGLAAACAYLGEAVAVCRSVLEDEDPVFEGTYLHVAGAVNRPPPRRPGGPPLLVEVPAGAAGLARREAGPVFLLRQAASARAAIVCPDDPGEIASWRASVEDAVASRWTGGDRDEVPAVVCRTTLRHPWTARSTRTSTAVTEAAIRSRLDAARAAGAGGVIVRVPSGRRGDEAFHLEPADAECIAGEVAECFEPWRR